MDAPPPKNKIVVVHLANTYDGQFFRVKQNVDFLSRVGGADIFEIRIRFPLPFKWINSERKAESISVKGVTLPVQCPWLGVFTRLWDAIWGFLISFFTMYCISPHLVLCETDFTSQYARYMKMFNRKALLIADFHGAAPEEYSYTVPNVPQGKIRYLSNRRKILCKYADVILCQSRAMANFLEEEILECNGKPVLYYPMTIAESWRISLTAIKQKRQCLRVNMGFDHDCHVFVYAGGLAKWQKVEAMLHIFKKYHDRYSNATFLFFSTTESVSWLPDEYIYLLHSGALVIKSVSHSEIADYLCAADVAFLLRDDILLNRVASPTKFGEYLSRGLPVITERVARCWGTGELEFDDCCIFADAYASEQLLVEGIRLKLTTVDDCLRQKVIRCAWQLYGKKENDNRLIKEVMPYLAESLKIVDG